MVENVRRDAPAKRVFARRSPRNLAFTLGSHEHHLGPPSQSIPAAVASKVAAVPVEAEAVVTGAAEPSSIEERTTPPPSFDIGFCPGSGRPGKAVTLVGLHFTGVTEVQFNGVRAKFSVKSDQIILTKVPRGATSGPITLVGPGGIAETMEDFMVEP